MVPAAEITARDFEAGDVWVDGMGTQWFAFRWGAGREVRVVSESGFRFRLEFFLTVVDRPLALLYRRAGRIAAGRIVRERA